MDPIDEISRDCFGVIIQLRHLDDNTLGRPEDLHKRLCSFVDAMIQRGRGRGVTQEDLGDAVFAIVALADEVVLAMPGAVQQFWMYNTLQLRYFNENVAGETFFQRLDVLRTQQHRGAVLRVYYLCLLFGFQGRYRVRGGDAELATITDGVHHDLLRYRVITEEVLAPHAGRPAEGLRGATRRLPVAWLSLAVLGMAILANVVLQLALQNGVDDVVDRISTLTGRAS